MRNRGNFKGGHKDNVQFYNVPKHDGVHDFAHPLPISSNLSQIQSFTRVNPPYPFAFPHTLTKLPQKINEKIIHPLLTLVGIILQLPNPTILTKDHSPEQNIPNDSLLRYMQYDPLPFSDSNANNGIHVAKHVDFGTFTCSFRQPVAGLQFLDGIKENEKGMQREEGGEWKWVKPMHDGVVVNAADWLACVTGRWCRSGVHRVHASPVEQVEEVRHAVIFFSR